MGFLWSSYILEYPKIEALHQAYLIQRDHERRHDLTNAHEWELMFTQPLFRASRIYYSVVDISFPNFSNTPSNWRWPLLLWLQNLIYFPFFSPKPSDKHNMSFLLGDFSYKHLTLGSSLKWLCLSWSIETPQNILLKGHLTTPMSALLHSQNGYIHLWSLLAWLWSLPSSKSADTSSMKSSASLSKQCHNQVIYMFCFSLNLRISTFCDLYK